MENYWPLMNDNIITEDRKKLIDFLSGNEHLTIGKHVKEFEDSWTKWLGTNGETVCVNSGASGNFISIGALGPANARDVIIVPPLGWVSDITSIKFWGFAPIVVDINPNTLALDTNKTINTIETLSASGYTIRAVVLIHVLGLNGLTAELLNYLTDKKIPLIEDCCEAHGATFMGKKVGSFGCMSVFSFYFGHHMSTIEGGTVTASSPAIIDTLRSLRNHGMIRDCSASFKQRYIEDFPELDPNFIFAYTGMNLRPTEIMGILGKSQLPRLDTNNILRTENLNLWLSNLDSSKYKTDYATEGSCNFALMLQLREANPELMSKVYKCLTDNRIEFRRGMSGGGNQLRQPYLKYSYNWRIEDFPNVEHVHFYGTYIGNYPGLDHSKILELTTKLNSL